MCIPIKENASLSGGKGKFIKQILTSVGVSPVMALREANCGSRPSAAWLLIKLVDFFVFLEDGNQSGEIAAMYYHVRS